MSFAVLISRLLDPMWVLPAFTILGAWRSGLQNFALWRIIVIVSFTMVAPLCILRLQFTKRHKTSGWDIKHREHRPKAIGILLVLGALNVILAWVFGNLRFRNLFIFYELWLSGFFLISLVWKISGHAGAIALATGLVIAWFGWKWLPILLLVPLVGWARVVTKNHTFAQVIIGVLYSWGFLYVSSIMYQVSR